MPNKESRISRVVRLQSEMQHTVTAVEVCHTCAKWRNIHTGTWGFLLISSDQISRKSLPVWEMDKKHRKRVVATALSTIWATVRSRVDNIKFSFLVTADVSPISQSCRGITSSWISSIRRWCNQSATPITSYTQWWSFDSFSGKAGKERLGYLADSHNEESLAVAGNEFTLTMQSRMGIYPGRSCARIWSW